MDAGAGAGMASREMAGVPNDLCTTGDAPRVFGKACMKAAARSCPKGLV